MVNILSFDFGMVCCLIVANDDAAAAAIENSERPSLLHSDLSTFYAQASICVCLFTYAISSIYVLHNIKFVASPTCA